MNDPHKKQERVYKEYDKQIRIKENRRQMSCKERVCMKEKCKPTKEVHIENVIAFVYHKIQNTRKGDINLEYSSPITLSLDNNYLFLLILPALWNSGTYPTT